MGSAGLPGSGLEKYSSPFAAQRGSFLFIGERLEETISRFVSLLRRFNRVRRVIFRSTGTKEVAAAKRIAAQIIESFWNDSGRGADELLLRHDNAKIGELIARYQKRATQRPSTVQGNVRSLRMIVKTIHSGHPDDKASHYANEAGEENELSLLI